MVQVKSAFLLLAAMLLAQTFADGNLFLLDPTDNEETQDFLNFDENDVHDYREKRSLQPGAALPNLPGQPGNNQKGPWEVNPDLGRDDNGNTHTGVGVKHTGPGHEVDAGWSKVVKGPNKAKPTWHLKGTWRFRRSLQPGAGLPNLPGQPGNNQKGPWEVNPDIGRDDNGNTHTGVGVKHTGPGHEVDAGWSKVVKGPNKAKPTWHVKGTWRFRRSLQPGAGLPNLPGQPGNNQKGPWEVNPNIGRDDNGNTHTGVGVKHTGPGHEVDAGWSKVVRGPNKAKPTWHVKGTWRFRRSLQPGAGLPNLPGQPGNNQKGPWEVNPDLGRDDNGNTHTGVGVKHTGPGHEVDAGWSKVVKGPNKAKPTWHVKGTWRFRRSLQPGAGLPNLPGQPGNNQKGPWEVNPDIGRDDNGNTHTGVGVKHTGPGHEVDAGWSKVVKGPNKAKPTWHVKGTWRFRRSLQPGAGLPNLPGQPGNNQKGPWEVNPDLGRDDNGNTHTGVGVKHTGPGHEVDAGWSKVVRGPNKAKPTWHLKGTWRFRRSLQPGAGLPNLPGQPGNNQKGPWEVNPDLGRDDNGNTHTGVGVKHTGPGHEVDAGWSKVVRGPNKAKPTWHVKGTWRFRRSLQPGAGLPNLPGQPGNNQKGPWEVNPDLGRDDNGNTHTGVGVKHTGPGHEVDAGWSKVVRGPNKAKPTWHLKGTFHF